MDFLKICRACTSEKTNLLNLFANDCDDEPTLGEKFLVCTSLQLEESDLYPQHICYSCAKLLETAFKFRKQCERSFQQMKKQFECSIKREKDLKVEPVYEPDDQRNESIVTDEEETVMAQRHATPKESNVNPKYVYKSESKQNQQQKIDLEALVVLPSDGEIATEWQVNDDKVTNKNIIGVDISIEERPHQCIDCSKSFFTLKALELHYKLNHRLKPDNNEVVDVEIHPSSTYQCSICETHLQSIDDLRMHRILVHGPKSLQCNMCGKSTRDRIAYKKHVLAHKNSNRHGCKICGKQYTDSRYLYRHMLYHGVTVYKCVEQKCEKTFNVKHKFVEHIRLYHNRHLTSEEVRQIQPVVKNIEED